MKEHKEEHKTMSKSHQLLAGLLIANLIGTLFLIVKPDASWKLEEMKAGGAEVFAMVQELYNSDGYKAQQKQSVTQYLEANKGAAPTADTAKADADANTNNDSEIKTDSSLVEKIKAIKNDGYVLGNKDAKITIIEYSDIVCPFCKRQYQQGTLEKVIEKYDGKVNKIFRQFPLVNLHPQAPRAAEAAECAGSVGGSDKFYDYLKVIFSSDDMSDTNLMSIAKGIGIKESEFKSCLDNGKMKSKVDAQLAEGQTFGVNGTPGNVIINTENGKFELVSGAYPVEKFEEVINKLLK